jgi:exopolysaccharide biosynthesis polyprenyl glycosylphosphotransferase
MQDTRKNIYSLKTRITFGLMLIVSDSLFLALSCFFSYYIRFYTRIFGVNELSYTINDKYLLYSLIFILIMVFLSFAFNLYSLNNVYRGPIYYPSVLIVAILGTVAIYFSGRVFSGLFFSRIWISLLFILSIIFLFLSRFAIGIAAKKIFKGLGIPHSEFAAGISENIRIIKNLPRFKKKLIFGFVLVINDIIFISLAFYVSYYLRFHTGPIAELNLTYQLESDYFFYSIIFIISAVLLFLIYRLYNWDYIYKGSGYYSRIIKGLIINIIVIIIAGYLFELFTFSRKWILLLLVFSVLFILTSRLIIELVTVRLIKRLNIRSRTVVVGVGENANRIEDSFRKYSMEGDTILGYVDKKSRILKNKKYSRQFNILGYLNDLEDVIHKNEIQRVIISSPEFKYNEMLEILEKIKGIDISVLIFPGFFEFSVKRMNMREIAGIPLMQVSNIGFFGFNLFLKNTIDYVLGSIMFLFFIPVYLVVGSAIKINSYGPIFYKQRRYTKDCRVFYMYKFRSMFMNADSRLRELERYNEADGPLFKIKGDPRITKVGRFIRKFSIDELPQIINVLKGEMSLVGPRPPLPSEVEKYDEWEMKRMNVKQGVTGLWQISGRSELSFEEMARLDLYYIQNWSIEMDIKVLLKTIPTVLFGRGAY